MHPSGVIIGPCSSPGRIRAWDEEGTCDTGYYSGRLTAAIWRHRFLMFGRMRRIRIQRYGAYCTVHISLCLAVPWRGWCQCYRLFRHRMLRGDGVFLWTSLWKVLFTLQNSIILCAAEYCRWAVLLGVGLNIFSSPINPFIESLSLPLVSQSFYLC